jgi:hypothetical protein
VARRPPSFFASPKKEGKERRPRDPALRVPGYAEQKMGSGRNSLRSDNAHFFSIFCTAQPAGSKAALLVRLAFGFAGQDAHSRKNPSEFSLFLNKNPKKSLPRRANPDAEGEDWRPYPLGTLPFVRSRKWIRNGRCLSVASFARFPFLASHKREPEGQRLRSPFLGYLFWRSKKGNWPPGHPRQRCIKYKEQL